MPKPRLLLPVLIAAVSFAAGAPSAAHAGGPCWKKVIADWSQHNGVIKGHYSPHCLRQAIKNTPEDLRDYSGIIDDINAALLDTLGGGGANSGNGAGGSGNPTRGTSGSMGPTGNPNSKAAGNGSFVLPDAGTPESAPGHDRSIPLPLLVLGSVLLAASLAAASPFLVRRFRGRFPRLRPAAQGDR